MDYGIEIMSDTGHKMVLPNDSPFVFYTYVDITVSPTNAGTGATIRDIGIPTNSKGLAFYRRLTSGQAVVMVNESAGNLRISVKWSSPTAGSETCTVRVYIFTNSSGHTSSGSYGIQIYDKNGQLVLANNSKPLNIIRNNYQTTTDGLDVGFPVAVMCSLIGWEYRPVSQPIPGCHLFAIVGSCEGTVIKNALFWTGFLPNFNYLPPIINNTSALCIDYSQYE